MREVAKKIKDEGLIYVKHSTFVLAQKNEGKNGKLLAGFAYNQSEWVDTPRLWFMGGDYEDCIVENYIRDLGIPVIEVEDFYSVFKDLKEGEAIKSEHYNAMESMVSSRYEDILEFNIRRKNELKEILDECSFYVVAKINGSSVLICYKEVSEGLFESVLFCKDFYYNYLESVLNDLKKPNMVIEDCLSYGLDISAYLYQEEGVVAPEKIIEKLGFK